jgi:hypothetical protein
MRLWNGESEKLLCGVRMTFLNKIQFVVGKKASHFVDYHYLCVYVRKKSTDNFNHDQKSATMAMMMMMMRMRWWFYLENRTTAQEEGTNFPSWLMKIIWISNVRQERRRVMEKSKKIVPIHENVLAMVQTAISYSSYTFEYGGSIALAQFGHEKSRISKKFFFLLLVHPPPSSHSTRESLCTHTQALYIFMRPRNRRRCRMIFSFTRFHFQC